MFGQVGVTLDRFGSK